VATATPRTRLPLVGQSSAIGYLDSWLHNGTLPPLLFTGPAGVGKRTAALMLSQATNCSEPGQRPCGICRSCRAIAQLSYPDLRLLLPIRLPKKDSEPEEVAAVMLARYPEFALGQVQPVPDPKLKIPIDAVRWLRVEMAKPPLQARRRFFVLLHAHQMNNEAANALLKTLEEPQTQSTLILTTASPTSLPPTIRSRCQVVRFSAVAPGALCSWLEENAGASSADAELAASVSGGSIGAALRFLESRDDFLVEPVVQYFAGRVGSNEQAILTTLATIKETPPAAVVGTLLFLYREALRLRLGGDSPYARRNPGVVERTAKQEASYLRRAVKFLLSRSREAGQNLNARLFSYSLLTTLKPPG
jgi:DNA polymerase III delta' subunit